MKLLPISVAAMRLGLSTASVYRLGEEYKKDNSRGLRIISIGPKKAKRVNENDLMKYIDSLLKEF